MAESKALIEIDTIKDDGPRKSTERVDELGDHATKTSVRLRLLASSARKASKDLLGLASSSAAAGGALESVDKKTKTLENVIYSSTKMVRQFGGALSKFLVGGLKMATLSLGAMSIALVGIHALFVAGRFLVKSYHVALKGLGATAAGAAVAIGLVSSAIREQQAAMFAYSGKNNKEFGSGLNQVRVNMRGLHMDAQLAGAGVETLNKAYAEIAKTKTGYLASSKSLLKDLGDFASAGQPLEEGLVKAAKVVATIQDPKKGLGAIQAAFKELGPAAEEALKKAKKEGIDTKKEFIEAMKSGKLSALGGVTGQMEAVNNTLMGQFKKYFNLIRGQFADFGQQFLPEAKVGLEKIYRIITRTMQMSSGAIAGWEKRGGFVDVIVGAVEKVSNFYLKLIREYLPKSEGMFNRLGEWWRNFKEGWREIVNGLRPFIDGARVIEKMFGQAWRPIWGEIKSATKEFNANLQRNQQNFLKLGSTIGNTVKELLSVLRIFERVIQENLPFINNMIRGIKVLVEQFSRIFKFMEGLPFFGGQLGSQGAMALMLAMARGMKTARGTVVDEKKLANTMNVQARQVSIVGTIQGAYQGFKLGSNPAIASATGGFGPLIGAGIGGAANGGWLGPNAQAKWQQYYPILRTANALTGGPDAVGGAAGALGLAGRMAPGMASSVPGLSSSTLPASAARGAVLLGGTPATASTAGVLNAELQQTASILNMVQMELQQLGGAAGMVTRGLASGTGGGMPPMMMMGPTSPYPGPPAGGGGGVSGRGLFNRMWNAQRGAGRGGAGLRGRYAAARTALTRGLASSTSGLATSTSGGGVSIPPMVLPPMSPGGPTSPVPGAGGGAPPAGMLATLRGLFRGGGAGAGAGGPLTTNAGTGNPRGVKKHFSALRRNAGRVMAVSNQMAEDKKARGSKYKMDGMIGSFLLQQGLSKLSNKVGDEDIKGGLGLASSMALFSPKLALGIAGGTFAVKSGNMGLAMGGGAMAGAAIGKSFGPVGTAVGAAIGTITGAIMAPINALKAKKKEAKKLVDDFFEATTGEFMVQLSLTESAARKSGKTETTVIDSMIKQRDEYRKLADIAQRGGAIEGKKGADLSLTDELMRGGGIGAAVGVASGAIIGTVVPVIGTAIGAAVGGIVGGVAGLAVGGASYGLRKGRDFLFGNRADDRKNTQKRIASVKELYAAGGMSDETFQRLMQPKKKKFARDDKIDNDLVDAYLDNYAKKADAMAQAQAKATDTVDARIKHMEKMTGKSSMELMTLAQTMGVNLADSTADFNEQLIKLGLTVVKTAREMDQAISELMQRDLETAFDTAIKQEKAPLIIDEAIKNFRQDYDQRGAGAAVTAEDSKLIFGTYFEQLTNAYGGDTSKAYFEMQRQIGSPDGLAFRDINPATGKKNPLGGLGNLVYSGMGGQAANQFLSSAEKSLTSQMLPQLGAVLAAQGKTLSAGGMKSFEQQFATLGIDQQERIFNAISSGDIGQLPQDFFTSFGMTGLTLEDIDEQTAAFKMATDNAEKEAILLEAEREVIEGMGKFFGPESQNPEWWSKDALRSLFIEAGIIKETGADTRTPRGSKIGDTVGSRLSRTLARHESMNSMISGKRMITSAYRDYNLGSSSSDHVTGRAYDLVGNQLGMYKTIVEKQGGFAEFHGGSANRHLHVVPGPGGPMGDTVSPYTRPMPAPVTTAPSKGGPISINLNVNGIGIKEAIPQIKAEIERSLYEYQNRV